MKTNLLEKPQTREVYLNLQDYSCLEQKQQHINKNSEHHLDNLMKSLPATRLINQINRLSPRRLEYCVIQK